MKTSHLPDRIKELAAITSMERGHLSIIRIGFDGQPSYNLQRREIGAMSPNASSDAPTTTTPAKSKAKTRMATLGCVFTQHQLDDKRLPLRDHQSITHLSGFESPSNIGIRLRSKAMRRRLATVKQVVMPGDGTLCLEKTGLDYFLKSRRSWTTTTPSNTPNPSLKRF